MKRIILFFLITVPLMAASCSRGVDTNVNKVAGYDEKTRSNGEDLKFESFNIVSLEQTDESIINIIKRVECVDSIILVQTLDDLLAFSNDGKYIRKYGRKGNGPEEFLSLSSFVVDKQKKKIRIIDEASSKILIFNIGGEFQSKNNYDRQLLSMWTVSGIQLNENEILFTNMVYKDKNALYTLFDIKSNVKTAIYTFPVKTDNTAEPAGRYTVSLFNDTVKLVLPFDNQVYALVGSKLIPTMSISTKKTMIEQKEIKAIENFSINTYAEFYDKNYFTGFTGIFETKDYILLDVLYNSNYFLLKKRASEGILFDYSLLEELLTLPLINIINADSDCFIGVGQPYKLIGMKERISSTIKDPNLTKLRKYIDNITFDSNPCLLFYKLR